MIIISRIFESEHFLSMQQIVTTNNLHKLTIILIRPLPFRLWQKCIGVQICKYYYFVIIIIISFHRQIFRLIKDHFASRNSMHVLFPTFAQGNSKNEISFRSIRRRQAKKRKYGKLVRKNKFQWNCNSLGIPSPNLESLLPNTVNELSS